MIDWILRRLNSMDARLRKLDSHEHGGRWIYPNSAEWAGTANTPLTSTSWDGDAYSTTAKTLIDLSTVFGAPAGVKAVLVAVYLRDAGSAGGDYALILSPNNTASQGFYFPCGGLANDKFAGSGTPIPCDTNGNIYYQVVASGAGSMDIYLQINGYHT